MGPGLGARMRRTPVATSDTTPGGGRSAGTGAPRRLGPPPPPGPAGAIAEGQCHLRAPGADLVAFVSGQEDPYAVLVLHHPGPDGRGRPAPAGGLQQVAGGGEGADALQVPDGGHDEVQL